MLLQLISKVAISLNKTIKKSKAAISLTLDSHYKAIAALFFIPFHHLIRGHCQHCNISILIQLQWTAQCPTLNLNWKLLMSYMQQSCQWLASCTPKYVQKNVRCQTTFQLRHLFVTELRVYDTQVKSQQLTYISLMPHPKFNNYIETPQCMHKYNLLPSKAEYA